MRRLHEWVLDRVVGTQAELDAYIDELAARLEAGA